MVLQVCQEGAIGCIFVFSFADISSLDEVDAALTRLAQSVVSDVCPIVVGTRYGAVSETEVSVVSTASCTSRYVLLLRNE